MNIRLILLLATLTISSINAETIREQLKKIHVSQQEYYNALQMKYKDNAKDLKQQKKDLHVSAFELGIWNDINECLKKIPNDDKLNCQKCYNESIISLQLILMHRFIKQKEKDAIKQAMQNVQTELEQLLQK